MLVSVRYKCLFPWCMFDVNQNCSLAVQFPQDRKHIAMSDNHERFLEFCRAGDLKNVQLLLSADPALLEIRTPDFVSFSQKTTWKFSHYLSHTYCFMVFCWVSLCNNINNLTGWILVINTVAAPKLSMLNGSTDYHNFIMIITFSSNDKKNSNLLSHPEAKL